MGRLFQVRQVGDKFNFSTLQDNIPTPELLAMLWWPCGFLCYWFVIQSLAEPSRHCCDPVKCQAVQTKQKRIIIKYFLHLKQDLLLPILQQGKYPSQNTDLIQQYGLSICTRIWMTDFLPIQTRSSFLLPTPPLLMFLWTIPPLLLFHKTFLFTFCLFFHHLKLLLFPFSLSPGKQSHPQYFLSLFKSNIIFYLLLWRDINRKS